ncbi:hypothetical protein [Aliiroseovarius sp. YM-037]|uniref:hypothetical protein n=1 Tax=Aliiroseovarius sp. YM-037 TaxID=3341728 RepID=UPI003A7FA665
MTALKKYQRLESTGLWRASPDSQRRDVIVSFGDATVVLTDKNDQALAHWSLPAITRLNPGTRPALFSPDPDGTETLELEDDTMIRAIDKVLAAVARRVPRPGRLRLFAFVGSIAAVLALVMFWLPGALVQHTASVVPDVTKADIGGRLLDNIRRLSGDSCSTANGDRALNRLRMRITPETRELVVLRAGVAESEHLPGGYILLNRGLVEDHEDPAVVAGFVLSEAARAALRDPFERMLSALGPYATFRLLTTGEISDETLAEYAERLLVTPQMTVADDRLLLSFADAGVPSSPYAYAVDISGETTLPLIEADPLSGQAAPKPILSDGDWIGLQNICGG